MGITSQSQWSGIAFAPFSPPELPFADMARQLDFSTEWAIGVYQEESRRSPRQSVQCEMLMVDPTWWESENSQPIRGECLNLSDDGLYGVVPLGYGLAVGQRYVFQLRLPEGELTVSQPGTIVRTELLLGVDGDRIGVGVRLSGPRNLVEE